MENTKTCTKCGTDVPEDSKFCYNCGNDKFINVKYPRQKFCHNCGNAVDADAQFCTSCGANQSEGAAHAAEAGDVQFSRTENVNTGYAEAPRTVNKPAKKKKAKKPLKWWHIVLVVLGVCILGGLGNMAEKRAQRELSQQTSDGSAKTQETAKPAEDKTATAPETVSQEPAAEVTDGQKPEETASHPEGTLAYEFLDPVIQSGTLDNGTTYLTCSIPIVNNDSSPILLHHIRVVITDSNGNVVSETRGEAYPAVVSPGGIALYAADSLNVTLSEDGNYTVSSIEGYSVDAFVEYTDEELVMFDVTGFSVEFDDTHGPKFSYTVVNNTAETAAEKETMSIVCVLDENDNVIDLLTRKISEGMAPGATADVKNLWHAYRNYDNSDPANYAVLAYKIVEVD